MKKNHIFAVLLLLLVIPWSNASADCYLDKDFASVRDITVPTLTGTEFVRLKLDRKVGAGSNQFKDVRVIRESDGCEVPYQLVVEDALVTSAFLSSRVLDTAT